MKTKKRFAIGLILFSLLLSGCSAEKESAGNSASTEPVQMATRQTLYPLPPQTDIVGITAAENACMVAGEADSIIYVAVMPYSVEADGVKFSDTVSFTYESRNHVYGIAANEKNFFLLVGNREEEQYTEETAQLVVLTISHSGELQNEAMLDASFALEPRGFAVSGDFFLIGGNSFIRLFNQAGELHSTVKADCELWAFQPTNTGAVVQLNDGGKFPLYTVDASAKLTPVEWDDEWLSFSRQDYSGKLIYGTDVFYEYDLNTGEQRELFSWLQLTGDIYRHDCFCRIAEDCYLYSGSGSALYLMQTEYKVDLRKPIRVAYLGDNSQMNARRLIAQFNLSNTEYRAEGTFYEKDDIALPITVGECPDVVLFSMDSIDTTTNQFLNLKPIFENSEALNENSLIPGMIEGLSMGDELHELWYSVAIAYWYGQSDFIDTTKDKTWEDYTVRAAELGDEYTVVDQEFNKNTLLNRFLKSEIHNYTDLDNWTCSFDSASFAELLKLCNETGADYSPIYDSDDRGAEYDAYMADYVERLPLINLSFLQNCRVSFPDGVTLIASPFSDVRASYDEDYLGSKICVPARTENVDAAFAFVEYVMSADTQIQAYFESAYPVGIPTNKEALEYCLDNVMKPENAEKLRALIDAQPQFINAIKYRLIAMTEESAQGYFAGDKSLDDTVKLIQSRASIYLAEKRR